MSRLEGVISALITPFKEDGSLDLAALEKHAAYLSEAGVQGFFVGGTTGEGAYLSTREKKEAFAAARGASRGRQFLCAACIQPSTRQVIEEMRELAALSPDFVVAVTPYYLAVGQDDIKDHFRMIAREAPAPLIMYNIPGNTHNPMALATMVELSAEPRAAGIKDSSGDFIQFSRGVLGNQRESFAWIQGEDYLQAAALLVGSRTMVSGLSNARVEPYVRMHRSALAGDWDDVRECQRRINTLYGIVRLCGNAIAASKAAAELAGRGSRRMRQASLSVTAEQFSGIARILEEFDTTP